jgi:hypothetical protein
MSASTAALATFGELPLDLDMCPLAVDRKREEALDVPQYMGNRLVLAVVGTSDQRGPHDVAADEGDVAEAVGEDFGQLVQVHELDKTHFATRDLAPISDVGSPVRQSQSHDGESVAGLVGAPVNWAYQAGRQCNTPLLALLHDIDPGFSPIWHRCEEVVCVPKQLCDGNETVAVGAADHEGLADDIAGNQDERTELLNPHLGKLGIDKRNQFHGLHPPIGASLRAIEADCGSPETVCLYRPRRYHRAIVARLISWTSGTRCNSSPNTTLPRPRSPKIRKMQPQTKSTAPYGICGKLLFSGV